MKKMNDFDSKSRFEDIYLNSHYLRVDDTHPLDLLIGLNDNGQKTIRLVGKYKKSQVKNTKTIEVNHFSLDNKIILSFSLINKEYVDLFYLFCNDLVDTSRHCKQEEGYYNIINRYEKWKGFSNSSRKFLSEGEIKGLIGELLFLKNDLVKTYGISRSVMGWSGPEPTKKDFYIDDLWYEVKTVTKDIVTISSIEQLDSDSIGYLVIYYLEKLSVEANGITLNKLVEQILNEIKITEDRSNFIMKLVSLGYYNEDYYNDFVYKLSSNDYYEVNDCFPRLNRHSLDKAISNVKYDIVISNIKEFKKESI